MIDSLLFALSTKAPGFAVIPFSHPTNTPGLRWQTWGGMCDIDLLEAVG